MAKPKADLHIAIPTTLAFPSPQDPITDTCTVDSRFADTCAVDGCSTTAQIHAIANRRLSVMRVSSNDDIENYVLPFSNTNTNNTISSTTPLHDGYNGEKERRGIWGRVWGGNITLVWRRFVDRLRSATSTATTMATALFAYARHVRSKLTWPMAKKVLRAAVAYWLAFLIELSIPIMSAIGPATFLAVVAVVYFQPARTCGALWESVFWGIIGVSFGTLLSFIAIELGNYVRGDEIFHYGAAAIYLVSLSIGTFVISYVKIKWPTMRFGSVYALIVIVFSLSTAYIQPAMSKIILRNLAIPMFIGPVISLVVNQLLWPEHGTTNYIPHLIETLHNFNALLKHETSFFLRNTYNKSIIYSLQKKTQKNLMNLQNVKRESLHEISYSKIGPVDLIEIAKIIKQMHMPLDGLALSGMIEEQLAYDDDNDIPEVRIDFLDENASYIDDDEPPPSPTGNTRDFQRLLEIIRPNCTDLAKACQICLEDCASRIAHLRHDCNPSWQFWCKGCNKDDIKNLLPDPMAVMSDALEKFHDARNEGLQNLFIENETISPSPQRLVLLLLLFEHNLEEFAVGLQVLIGLVKHLESSRMKKQLWWPPMPFLKRMQVRKTVEEGTWKVVEPDPRIDDDMGEGEDDFCDPDVRVPHTKSQIFWYRLWKIRNWLGGKYVRFAMKNTLIVTLLMLPCFLPSTSSTFQSLRAQWAVITAILAFWPTTGGAILQFICRICGSLIGAGLAIIAWLVTGGNPIGLAAALFFISLFLWFIFHNTRMWTVGSVIMLITFPLILGNEYQNVHGIGHFDEDIFLLAGKRTLAVATGIFTAFIMTVLPWPHTGRVEIRHRLARTISQVGVLYSMTVAFFLKDDSSPCAHTTKAFRKLLTRIQRSTNTERLLLSRTKYEPPLRGDFPRDLYEEMIDVVEHMTCIIARMAHTLTGLDEEWKENLRNVLKRPSKRYYVTHILVAFHILSNALERRSPLPPYSIAPKKVSRAGIKFWSKVKTLDELTEEQLTRPAYACYCSYLIKTGHLGNELIKLVDVMRQLVGINRFVKELIDF